MSLCCDIHGGGRPPPVSWLSALPSTTHEDVVDLVEPERGHDEEELDAHGAEGEDAAQGHAEERVRVPLLLRHVPVCLGGRVVVRG